MFADWRERLVWSKLTRAGAPEEWNCGSVAPFREGVRVLIFADRFVFGSGTISRQHELALEQRSQGSSFNAPEPPSHQAQHGS